MHIQCLGLNHIAALLSLREQLSFNEDGIRTALARLACGHITTSIVKLIIISAFDCTELYAVSNELAFAELETFLSDVRGIAIDQFDAHLYLLKGRT